MTDMPERLWALDAAAGERWLRCKIEPNPDAFEQTEYIRSDIVAKKISDAENQTVRQVCELYGIDVYQTMIDLDWKVTKDFEE